MTTASASTTFILALLLTTLPTTALSSTVSRPRSRSVAAFVGNSNARATATAIKKSTEFSNQLLYSKQLLNRRPSSTVELRYSPFSELDTAFEWLAKERFEKDSERHQQIQWVIPSDLSEEKFLRNDVKDDVDTADSVDKFEYAELKRMPLYPLGEVHIPFSGETHTLINTEPRNVKMARDIVKGEWDNLFCVTLRARDTNRISPVGTIMQLIQAEEGNIPSRERVTVTCRAIAIAEVIHVENPTVWEPGNADYLVAKVNIRPLPNNGPKQSTSSSKNDQEDHNDNKIAREIINNYQQIKSIYMNSRSIANSELPNFARDVMTTMPDFTNPDILYDETKFWTLVDTWQKMCNTVRHIKRYRLQGYVNEILIEVAEMIAKKKGEPLQLPVRREKMPDNVQRQIENMEEKASRDFIELGMDPILNFLELLIMESHEERVEKLAWMIEKERLRLEAKESLIKALLKDVEGMPGVLKDTGGFN